jgi:DNA (cytosine-5)-methyltransferase 1
MPTAVSLFSGAGGFCEGVRLAGFKVVCAVEMDGYAIRTHSANFPKVPMFRGDVTRFLVDVQPGVPSKRELIVGGVDLVYGGPPCQGFSQIGPRDLKDPRNLLYLEFARVLKVLKPKAFIMENVPNMVAMKNSRRPDTTTPSSSLSRHLSTACRNTDDGFFSSERATTLRPKAILLSISTGISVRTKASAR